MANEAVLGITWKVATRHFGASHTLSKKRHQQQFFLWQRSSGCKTQVPPQSLIWIIIACLPELSGQIQLALVVIIPAILLNYWAGQDYKAKPTMGRIEAGAWSPLSANSSLPDRNDCSLQNTMHFHRGEVIGKVSEYLMVFFPSVSSSQEDGPSGLPRDPKFSSTADWALDHQLTHWQGHAEGGNILSEPHRVDPNPSSVDAWVSWSATGQVGETPSSGAARENRGFIQAPHAGESLAPGHTQHAPGSGPQPL